MSVGMTKKGMPVVSRAACHPEPLAKDPVITVGKRWSNGNPPHDAVRMTDFGVLYKNSFTKSTEKNIVILDKLLTLFL